MRVSDLTVGMISYFVGTEHVFAILIDGDGASRRFELARCRDVAPRIDELMDALAYPLAWVPSLRSAVVRRFADEWGATLLPPHAALAPFDVLLIVPHHFLHGVPLHLARAGGAPLATTHGVAYCSSATLLDRCGGRNPARRVDPLAWTFPLDGDGATPSGPAVVTCKAGGADVLTGKDAAYLEFAATFGGHFPQTARCRTRDDVKTALNPRHTTGGEPAVVAPDVLCLVCHGHVDPSHIDRSGLLLWDSPASVMLRGVRVHGNASLKVQDHPFAEVPLRLEPRTAPGVWRSVFEAEMMTTSELRVLCESRSQLVALFGCSTGSGALASNDDYVSLAYQWLKIGAASVIANLWEADLGALAEWSHRFIQQWTVQKQPKAIAVREATRAFLADRPEWAGQPETWGCVALLGDWL